MSVLGWVPLVAVSGGHQSLRRARAAAHDLTCVPMTIAVLRVATTPPPASGSAPTRVSPAQDRCCCARSDLTRRASQPSPEAAISVADTSSASLAPVEALRQMSRAAPTYAHLGRVARMAAVLHVDPLDRHLASTRLLEDDPGAMVEIVAAAGRTARPRVPPPLDLARRAGEFDLARPQRRAAEVVVAPARRAHDLEGHTPRVGISMPPRVPIVAVSTPMTHSSCRPHGEIGCADDVVTACWVVR